MTDIDEDQPRKIGRPLKGLGVRNTPLSVRVEPWVVEAIDYDRITFAGPRTESRADVLTRWAEARGAAANVQTTVAWAAAEWEVDVDEVIAAAIGAHRADREHDAIHQSIRAYYDRLPAAVQTELPLDRFYVALLIRLVKDAAADG